MIFKMLLLILCLLASARIATPGKCPLKDGVMMPLGALDNQVLGTSNATVKIMGHDSLVMSPVDGRVRAVFEILGNVSIIKDTATYTCYMLDSATVKEGQLVKAGQIIGFARKKQVLFFVSNYRYTHINGSPQTYVDCVCKLPQP